MALGLCRLIGVEFAKQRLVIGVEEIVPDLAFDVVAIRDGRAVLGCPAARRKDWPRA